MFDSAVYSGFIPDPHSIGNIMTPIAKPKVFTLPDDTVQTLAGNTVAVKTDVPDKLGEWRETLTGARSQFAGRGDDWANEVAFADALLAILNDQSPVIAPDNPYADVIDRVVEAIGKYRIGR
jgi:hypothetical protein